MGQLYYLLIFIFNNAHRISPYCLRQYLYKKAGFHISDKSAVSGSVKFFTRGNLCIKKNTIINQRVYLDNRYPIHIGRNVSISHDVRIYTLGHKINDPLFSLIGKPVNIEDYVVVFAGAYIMPGVTLGEGSVVLPAAVVTKDVRPYTVVGGNPAKPVSKRTENLLYKFDKKYYFTH